MPAKKVKLAPHNFSTIRYPHLTFPLYTWCHSGTHLLSVSQLILQRNKVLHHVLVCKATPCTCMAKRKWCHTSHTRLCVYHIERIIYGLAQQHCLVKRVDLVAGQTACGTNMLNQPYLLRREKYDHHRMIQQPWFGKDIGLCCIVGDACHVRMSSLRVVLQCQENLLQNVKRMYL